MALLCQLRCENATPWRKLVDLRELRAALTSEEIERIGACIRAVNFITKVGPLAVIMPYFEPQRIVRLLGFLAAADRQILVTHSAEAADR